MISRTLIIAPGLMAARELAKEHGDGFAASPLTNLAGHRFHAVHVHDVLRTREIQIWLKDVVDRRMDPGTFQNVFFHDSPVVSEAAE